MIDMHCHILPEVDDGAKSMAEAKKMLSVAKQGGVSTIIATPHYRGRWTDRAAQKQAYLALKPEAEKRGITLAFGCEFYFAKFEAEEVPTYRERFCLGDSNRFLFELGTGTTFSEVENWIYELQRAGLEVILAHPERNAEIRSSKSVLRRYLEIGCLMQVSSDALTQSPFSAGRRTANYLIKSGNCDFIASDAHSVSDYEQFIRVMQKHRGA